MRSPGATVRKRLALLMSVFFLLFLCVVARLADLQIVQAQALTQRGMKQWTRSGIVSPKRGGVVDTKGRMLAQSMTSFVLTASPKEIKDPEALAKVLERELGLDAQSVIRKIQKNKNAAAVTLKRQVMREDTDRIRAIRLDAKHPDRIRAIRLDEKQPDSAALAGSTLELWDGVKNLMRFARVPLEDAIACATLNPARMVGIDARVGSIDVGKRADLLLTDAASMDLYAVILGGELLERSLL